jgi:hypothetical protein
MLMTLPFHRSGEIPPAALIVGGIIVIILLIAAALMFMPKVEAPDGVVNETPDDQIITPPENQNCVDTDSGKNTLENGTVVLGSESKTDSCASETFIVEYYCQNNMIVNESIECPQNHICMDGKCTIEPEVVPMCTDSDGRDELTSGFVNYSGKVYNDECVMIDQVKEYYCINDSLSHSNYICDPGFQCIDGACIEMPTNCTDSDLGKDESKKGMVSITKGFTLFTKESDYCVDENNVREFYCDNSTLGSQIIKCGEDHGCTNGACIYQSCEDSDGGQNLLSAGITSKGTVSETDKCSDVYNVIEYFCSDNKILSTTNTCPSGYWCEVDKCVPEPNCVDSDGKDPLNYGTVTKGSITKTDECNGIILTEWYCDGKTIKSEEFDCTGTGACSSGACIVT